MMELDKVHHAEALEFLATLPDNSVDLIATDPPYHGVLRRVDWDNQHDSAGDFLSWIGKLAQEWERVLKPNGSLYVFAFPHLSAQVQLEIGRVFNVLNHIVWVKPAGRHKGTSKEAQRMYFPQTERIIFAEHYGADSYAKGEAMYGAKCDELRGFVFEPLRAYFDGERIRAGVKLAQITEWFGARGFPKFVTARHTFSPSQWELPTSENYERLRRCFSELNHGGEYLRREYEDLRREYEDLRRPFNSGPDMLNTDVWVFDVVQNYKGKHPAEKPLALMEQIATMSSRPGAVVLDTFVGSGTTMLAAKNTGRHYIGCDFSEKWVARARQRLAEGVTIPALASPPAEELPLFAYASASTN
jgi:adenine-specific DNA-methyltransferase